MITPVGDISSQKKLNATSTDIILKADESELRSPIHKRSNTQGIMFNRINTQQVLKTAHDVSFEMIQQQDE